MTFDQDQLAVLVRHFHTATIGNLTTDGQLFSNPMVGIVGTHPETKKAGFWLVACPAGSPEDKATNAAIVCAVAAAVRATAYVSSSDAWSADLRPEEIEAWYATGRSLAEHPDRFEIVMTFGATKDGRHAHLLSRYDRLPDGKPTNFREQPTGGGPAVDNRHRGIFDYESAPGRVRALGRELLRRWGAPMEMPTFH